MRRINRHKIKTEQPESSYSRDHEEHDLAYYIHDRVELMHQVFSVLKYKQIKEMAPESVRNLSIGDLQELCTEELLGISSKRLLATLDGAEPPSDTESSSQSPSPDPMETISLDSISSDEEILRQSIKKKRHKHRRSSKAKKKREKPEVPEEPPEVSKASRAGLTVLELLELQARARAIRAQLQNEQAQKQEVTINADSDTDGDAVEIKEEAPDVVEISSGDEKPDLTLLQYAAQKSPKSKETPKMKELPKPKEPTKHKEPQEVKEPETVNNKESPIKAITRKSNELIITVPQAKATRKIKLKRNKVTVKVPNVSHATQIESHIVPKAQQPDETPKEVAKSKKKQKKSKKMKSLQKEGSDHDEITLQLSDSEKMDLLEDLNEKNYDKLSSSTSDSESSSSDSEADVHSEPKVTEVSNKVEHSNVSDFEAHETEKASDETDNNEVEDKAQSPVTVDETGSIETSKLGDLNSEKDINNDNDIEENVIECNKKSKETDHNTTNVVDTNESETQTDIQTDLNTVDLNQAKADESTFKDSTNEIVIVTETQDVSENNAIGEHEETKEVEIEKVLQTTEIDNAAINSEEKPSTQNIVDQEIDSETSPNKSKESERVISEGELSDRESSEVEALDVHPEVVCISDDEKQKISKKKKKKDKKNKKEKKAKKSKKDFRKDGDQNFYKDADNIPLEPTLVDITNEKAIDVTNVDVYEILELSDDSSCYEVEGTVLSKEPTAEEIEALSARIDEINRDEVVVDEINRDEVVVDEINNIGTAADNDNSEQTNQEDESELENPMSWKERYLDSKKVKRVLTTANILNALRNKNKELKRKINEAKKKDNEIAVEEIVEEKVLEEGSIEHYQALPAGSKYVEPETESAEGNEVTGDKTDANGEAVTKEMKKDAKQLLKMFKKLINSRKDKRREKKKKRKQKKQLGADGWMDEATETAI